MTVFFKIAGELAKKFGKKSVKEYSKARRKAIAARKFDKAGNQITDKKKLNLNKVGGTEAEGRVSGSYGQKDDTALNLGTIGGGGKFDPFMKNKGGVTKAYHGRAIKQPTETKREFAMRHENHTATKGMKDYYKDII